MRQSEFSVIGMLQMLLRVVYISSQSFDILNTLMVSVYLFQKSWKIRIILVFELFFHNKKANHQRKSLKKHIMLFVHSTFIFTQNPPLTDMVKAFWNRILSLPCGPWIPDHSGFGIVSGDRAASSRLKDVNCWIRRTRNNDASLYANYTNQLMVNLFEEDMLAGADLLT